MIMARASLLAVSLAIDVIRHPPGAKGGDMSIGIQAPSLISVVVSLDLAVLAIVCFFVVAPTNLPIVFWISIMAYVVGAFGVMVKTD